MIVVNDVVIIIVVEIHKLLYSSYLFKCMWYNFCIGSINISITYIALDKILARFVSWFFVYHFFQLLFFDTVYGHEARYHKKKSTAIQHKKWRLLFMGAVNRLKHLSVLQILARRVSDLKELNKFQSVFYSFCRLLFSVLLLPL